MCVCVSVCHTCYNCTKALNFKVFRLKDFMVYKILTSRSPQVFETCLPKKAVGEMIPVLLATTIAIPDSRYGAVKSTADSLSELIWNIFVCQIFSQSCVSNNFLVNLRLLCEVVMVMRLLCCGCKRLLLRWRQTTGNCINQIQGNTGISSDLNKNKRF